MGAIEKTSEGRTVPASCFHFCLLSFVGVKSKIWGEVCCDIVVWLKGARRKVGAHGNG